MGCVLDVIRGISVRWIISCMISTPHIAKDELYFNATRGDRREVVWRATPLLLFCWLLYMASFSN